MNVSGTTISATGHKGGLGDGLYDRAGARPDLDLDFAKTKSLKDRVSKEELITFTRGASRIRGTTYVDENGLIKIASHNLVRNSHQIGESSTWDQNVSSGASLTLTMNTTETAAPNDMFEATKLVMDSGTTASQLTCVNNNYSSFTSPFEAYDFAIFSVYLKSATNSNQIIQLSMNGTGRGVFTVTPEWQRFAIRAQRQFIHHYVGRIGVRNATTASNPPQSDGSYINQHVEFYAWGAQLEFDGTTGSNTNSGSTTGYTGPIQELVRTGSSISGAPRFTHDPETLESKGLLIEQQSTNLSKPNRMKAVGVNTRVTMNSLAEQAAGQNTNSVVSPDGTAVGVARAYFTGNESDPTGSVYFFNRTGDSSPYIQTTFDTSGTHTSSVFVKPALETVWQLTAHNNYASASAGGSGLSMGVTFTLTGNGTVTAIGTGIIDAGIKKYPNGWYRLSVTYHRNSTSTVYSPYGVLLYAKTHLTYNDFTSNTGQTSGELGYFWGPQVEASAVLTSYIPTNDAEATRSPDLVSIEGDNFGTYRQNILNYTVPKKHIFGTSSSDTHTITEGSLTDYADIAPDGTYSATLFTESTGNDVHNLRWTATEAFDATTDYTWSCYLKKPSTNGSRYAVMNTYGGAKVVFDLQNGTILKAYGQTSSNVQNSITPVGNSWYRCSTTVTSPASPTNKVYVGTHEGGAVSDASGHSFTGDGESGILVWGAQLEKSSTMTEYIPSTDTFTNRQSDATFVDGNGIIRTSKKNYFPVSENYTDSNYWVLAGNLTFTLNNKVAPDGTLTAHTPSVHCWAWGTYYKKSDGTHGWHIPIGANNLTITSEWERFSYTFTVESDAHPNLANYRIYPLRNGNGGSHFFYTSPMIFLEPGKTYTYSAWYKLIDNVAHVWGVQVVKGTEAGYYYKTIGTASGPPRYSHDPETLTPTGLYLEAKTTNDARDTDRLGSHYSQHDTSDVFIQGPYHYSHSTRKTETGITNPDGSTDGTCVVTVNSGTHNRQQPRGFRLPNVSSLVGRQVSSVFVKRKTSTARYVLLFMGGTGTYQQCLFDFDTETVVENTAPHNLADNQQYNSNTDYLVERGVVKYPNGWYRLYIIVDTGSGTIAGNGYGVGLAKDPATSKSANVTDDGPYDGTEAIYVWGLNRCSANELDSNNVQQETHLSSYIKNSTTDASEVTRTPDNFTSTATEVLDRANGTKPAFFTTDGISYFAAWQNLPSTSGGNLSIFNNETGSFFRNGSNSIGYYSQYDGSPSVNFLTANDNTDTGNTGNKATYPFSTRYDPHKGAFRFKHNDFIIYADGIPGTPDPTTPTIKKAEKMYIGNNNVGDSALNGTLSRIAIWKTGLTNNKLDRITS